jgi:hypothetical protein
MTSVSRPTVQMGESGSQHIYARQDERYRIVKRMRIGSVSLGATVIVLCVLLASETAQVIVTDKPIYLRPRDAGTLVMPQTSIAIRYNSVVKAAILQPDMITVEGSLSGRHDGTTSLADDQRTIVFKPAAPFTEARTGSTLVVSRAPSASRQSRSRW